MRGTILLALMLVSGPTQTGIGQKTEAPEMESTILAAGGVSGRVFDSNGEPMKNAVVGILRTVYRRGARSFVVLDAQSSDEDGGYRLYPVPPGEYYVGAAPPTETHATTLHPNTTNLNSASKIRVIAAGEVTGIDIHVRAMNPAMPRE